MFRIRFVLVIICFPLFLIAQNNRLYTTQHGLKTSNIQSLTIDRRGILWIGSSANLAFFDGTGFHYLPNFNPTNGQPYYSIVNRVYEDKDDCYWVLTNYGLYYFDARLVNYKRIMFNSQENEGYGYTPTQMLDYPGKPGKKIVVTSGYGIFVIDTEKKEVCKELTERLQQRVNAHFIISAEVDRNHRLWLSTIHNEMICYDLMREKLVQVEMDENAYTRLKSELVNKILEVQPHSAIYLATDNGVLKYNEKTNKIECIEQTDGRPYKTMLYTQNGELLLGTDSYGVLQITADGQVSEFELVHPVHDLSTGKVRDMLQDSEGNLIIALYQKGIFIIPRHDNAFNYNCISKKGDWRNSSCITSIQFDVTSSNYWIATDGAGVFTTEGTQISSAHPCSEGLNSLLVQSIVTDHENNIWVASYGGGVQEFDKENQRFITPEWLSSLKRSHVLSLAIDKTNAILYVGTNGTGVYAANLRTQTVEKVKCSETQGEWTTNLYVDSEHTLWIAELGAVGYTNPINGKHGQLGPELHTYDTQCICSMGQGASQLILLGSSDGLAFYNPTDNTMERILQGKPVLSINQTDETLWVGSTNCIYAVDKKTREVTSYTSLGGYYIGEFHRGATMMDNSGNILFGCDNGIISFAPKAISSNRRIQNEIVFTSIKAGGVELHYSDSTDYMDADIMYAKEINLSHKQNTFSINFNVPNYSLAHQIHYEYRLEGYEDKWNLCTEPTNQKATYSYISPGTYKLHIKAYLEGTPESTIEKTLTIHICPPWYNTLLANIIYIAILLLLIYVVYHFWKVRRDQKAALLKSMQNEQIKEEKLNLFTSITHELRTPLTMILSPLKQLMLEAKDEQTRNNLNTMKYNCDRLLGIVKQITDIRKIDAGQFRLHFEEVDICKYTRQIAQSFMGAATAKHINFSIEDLETEIHAWIDPVHFEKVIVNILSNAFKFCPEGGKITIHQQRISDNIRISIYNTGSHIDERDIGHVFERFYQSVEGQKHVGSGIGLNLAYELMHLHHGTITTRNVEPDGVEFSIELPARNNHLSAEELEPRPKEHDASAMQAETESVRQSIETHIEMLHTEANTNEGNNFDDENRHRRPNILIVDDSKELCEYLREQLSSLYDITLAFSGNSAWNMILQSRPELIITDMKMPDGDGIELCRKIKSNAELDDTPVILLTGEGDESVHVEALNLHVDHFMQKPFNVSILQGVIRQLLAVRENIKRHIQRKDMSNEYKNVEIVSVEDQLFERINQCVLAHLDDDNFGVQELANEVGISRVHLNRKMKEKYGMSPNVFIRTYRLKQAAYLLLHKRVNVSEVAYRVGFSTHSYFSSSFRDFFGMTPKEFVIYYNDPDNADKAKKLLE